MKANYKRDDLMMVARHVGLKPTWHVFGDPAKNDDGVVMVNHAMWRPYDNVSTAIEMADTLRMEISFKDRVVVASRGEFRSVRDIDKEETNGRRMAMCRAIVDLAVMYVKEMQKYKTA